MGVTGAAALTGLIVTFGTWAKGDQLNVQIFVGGGVYFLGIAAIESYNDKFAKRFAMLVLIGSLFLYAPAIIKRLSLNHNPTQKSGFGKHAGAGKGNGGGGLRSW
jgi:hypothetical protein